MTVNACRAYSHLKGLTATDISATRIFFGDELTGIAPLHHPPRGMMQEPPLGEV